MLEKLWNNEDGFVLSAELAIVLTVGVIGVITGLSHVAMAINQELTDLAQSVGALNQSFSYTGFACCSAILDDTEYISSATPGSSYTDQQDLCDDQVGMCADVATCSSASEADHT